MPIYEYKCSECNHSFESLQKLGDAPLVICPNCGRPALNKLVSAAAFHLKGSGWYETDFKDKKAKNNDNIKQKTKKTDKTETVSKTTSTQEVDE